MEVNKSSKPTSKVITCTGLLCGTGHWFTGGSSSGGAGGIYWRKLGGSWCAWWGSMGPVTSPIIGVKIKVRRALRFEEAAWKIKTLKSNKFGKLELVFFEEVYLC